MALKIKLLVSAIALSGVLVLAPKEVCGQDASESSPPSQMAPRQEAGQSATLAPGTPINVAIDQTLDSKKLAAGASVTAKTTEEVKQDGRVLLPKGTKVLGHVTVSSARSKGDSDSTLALQFDRAEVKGGQQVVLRASIQAMAAAPVTAQAPSDLQGVTAPGSNGTSGMTGRGGNMPGASSGAASTVPRTNQGGTSQGASDPSVGAGATASDSSETLKPNSRGVFGLGGLSLDESTVNSGQGTLIHSAGKTVHLDGGTRLLLVTQGATTAQR